MNKFIFTVSNNGNEPMCQSFSDYKDMYTLLSQDYNLPEVFFQHLATHTAVLQYVLKAPDLPFPLIISGFGFVF